MEQEQQTTPVLENCKGFRIFSKKTLSDCTSTVAFRCPGFENVRFYLSSRSAQRRLGDSVLNLSPCANTNVLGVVVDYLPLD